MTTPTFDARLYTILVVDDDPNNLGVIVNYLEACNFQVVMAKDAETGLKRATIVRPDLILLDVMMSGISGFELCRRLKSDEETKKIPVIFITALENVL